ncbi:MAG TPA: tryptophan synthase subunit alpha [Dehalococcoidia bacterium]|nr:tryptophan synthase subunit alpha [Dehalococcoidia bacterium]
MSQLASVFTTPEHKALIAYVTVGYPSIEATLEVVPLLASLGCDVVELGIPFSDPLADGVTIQEASYRALRQGVSPLSCLDTAARLREKISIPLIFMTYYNPVFSFGIDNFCQACLNSGIDGLIIPDLPPEESNELETSTQQRQLDLIYLLAPNSPEERIRVVAQKSRGFIYLVSLTGTTGARERLPPDLESFVARVRQKTSQPLCVGFGISTPEQAQRVAKIADGTIVGSRLIQLLDERPLNKLAEFIKSLRKALDNHH